MDVEIPRAPLVMVPLNIVGVGVNNVGFANIVVPIDPEDNLYVHLYAERYIEDDLAPAQIEFLVEVVGPNERTAKVSVHGDRVFVCCIHVKERPPILFGADAALRGPRPR